MPSHLDSEPKSARQQVVLLLSHSQDGAMPHVRDRRVNRRELARGRIVGLPGPQPGGPADEVAHQPGLAVGGVVPEGVRALVLRRDHARRPVPGAPDPAVGDLGDDAADAAAGVDADKGRLVDLEEAQVQRVRRAIVNVRSRILNGGKVAGHACSNDERR